jgi:hypothetical protein
MTYNTVNEWLDEMENFSTRRERMLMDESDYAIEKWVSEAFRQGQIAGMSKVLETIKPNLDAIKESNNRLGEILNRDI